VAILNVSGAAASQRDSELPSPWRLPAAVEFLMHFRQLAARATLEEEEEERATEERLHGADRPVSAPSDDEPPAAAVMGGAATPEMPKPATRAGRERTSSLSWNNRATPISPASSKRLFYRRRKKLFQKGNRCP
jgi:hypothetical protein